MSGEEMTLEDVAQRRIKELRNILDQTEYVLNHGRSDEAIELMDWLVTNENSVFGDLIGALDGHRAAIDPKARGCVDEILDGWTVGEFIGSGAAASTFLLTKAGTEEKRVLREAPHGKMEQDAELAIEAGELGIGPKVYGALICPVKRSIYPSPLYMVSHYLPGPSLYDALPFDQDYLRDALTLYYDLLTRGGIAQGDLAVSNLKFDGDRLYLYDYDNSKRLEAKELLARGDTRVLTDEMIEAAMVLLDSISRADFKHAEREKILALYNDTINKWMADTFPKTKPHRPTHQSRSWVENRSGTERKGR